MANCHICERLAICPWASPQEIICSSFKRKPITNSDRIRSMTDEELAEFVAGTDFCELLCNDTPVCIDGQCFARLFKWLQQEAKDA